jgi:hypothetical protein
VPIPGYLQPVNYPFLLQYAMYCKWGCAHTLVGRALCSVNELVSETLCGRLDVAEGGFTGLIIKVTKCEKDGSKKKLAERTHADGQ